MHVEVTHAPRIVSILQDAVRSIEIVEGQTDLHELFETIVVHDPRPSVVQIQVDDLAPSTDPHQVAAAVLAEAVAQEAAAHVAVVAEEEAADADNILQKKIKKIVYEKNRILTHAGYLLHSRNWTNHHRRTPI
tara:strand:- start:90 stop:488 length:399 start_codon:yes stop_codon:yes gene_type:complete